MEVDYEIEKKSNESDDDEVKKSEIETDIIEVNDIDSKENANLYVASYGNGVAFIKSVFYKALRENRVLKSKFWQKNVEFPNRPKKLVAELYQIQDYGNAKSIVLLLKQDFNHDNYIRVVDYLKANFSFKNIASFNSMHKSE